MEAPGGEIESVKKLVKREMEGGVFELNVPLLVEVGVGRNCAMPGKLKNEVGFRRPRSENSLKEEFENTYFLTVRRRSRPKPSSEEPIRAIVTGSGVPLGTVS